MDIAPAAFGDIPQYVVELLRPPTNGRALAFYTADRKRGFVLQNDSGQVDVTFAVDRGAPDEASVRAFFAAERIGPWRDYLANEGEDGGATSIMAYPVVAEVE